jgi:non-specific serine/threonine protein kinase/serine/threonine-protein kinase
MNSLAIVLVKEGIYAEAEKLDRDTLEIRRRILGPEHPLTLSSTGNLADVLSSEGHLAEAEKLLRETLEVQRRVLGPEGPDAALSTYNIGCVLAREGKREQALALLREAIDHGLRPVLDLAIDRDQSLTSLDGDPRFAALVAHAKEVAAAAQKTK